MWQVSSWQQPVAQLLAVHWQLPLTHASPVPHVVPLVRLMHAPVVASQV
jgi:hypothetical protein